MSKPKNEFFLPGEQNLFVKTLKETGDFDAACAAVPQVNRQWIESGKVGLYKLAGIAPPKSEPGKKDPLS